MTTDHFDRLARLLDLESRAEAQQAVERARRLSPAEAERTGTTLLDLTVVDEDAGLGGRSLVLLAKSHRGALPWTQLDVGSPVVLTPQKSAHRRGHRGVVSERGDSALRVAFADLPEDLGDFDTWRLDLCDDDVSLQRQKAALRAVQQARGNRLAELRRVLLGDLPPRCGPLPPAAPLDGSLNESQQEAVRFALAARDVALIHGPPGTGKTTAVVEVIRRAVRDGARVLACAPSNLAVDNIFSRLLAYGEQAVRLGHPARVLPALRQHTLDLLVEDHADVRLARKLVKDARALFRRASRFTRARPEPGARQQTRAEAKSLLADARRLENQAVEQILDSARIVCATTTGLDEEIVGNRRFDLAVIDEACQSVEPACWIPLLRCDRVVLAGDHCQLPPTIVSQEAAKEGLGVSLFERLMTRSAPLIARRLCRQYRMHETIMEFSSLEFYQGELQADESVRRHRLAELPGVQDTPLTRVPLIFIDTAGASFDEQLEPDGESRWNEQEAVLIARKVQELLEAGVAPQDVAVIAPYAAQVRLLRDRLPVPGLEINSVDGFQGREKEAVLISLVRSNARGEIGFLGDVRRMNVAMTRARRLLLLVGDMATLASNPFYQRVIGYCERQGAYRTVWEEGVP